MRWRQLKQRSFGPHAAFLMPLHQLHDLVSDKLGRTVLAAAVSELASPPRNCPGWLKGSLTKRKTDEVPRKPELEMPKKMSVAVHDRVTKTFSQECYRSMEQSRSEGTYFYYLLGGAAWLHLFSPPLFASIPLFLLFLHLLLIICNRRILATCLIKAFRCCS